MVDRPYHDYATSALRELNRDLTCSQAQLEDQREDYAKRADSDVDELRQLEVLVGDLGQQLAAIDKELSGRLTPKPHCRAKGLPRHGSRTAPAASVKPDLSVRA